MDQFGDWLQGKATGRLIKSYVVKTCARLKAFREETGLTASDVAEHLQIPTALYVLYEGHELVPHQLIPPLCEFLNMSSWFYLTGKSDELSPPYVDKSTGYNPCDSGVLKKKLGSKPR